MGRQSIYYLPTLLILILFPIVLMVLSVTQLVHAASDDDPFAPYAAVMPGQPSAALNEYSCLILPGPEQASEHTRCRLPPIEGHFSEVTIWFHQGYQITEVTLTPESLLVGDLVQRWGMPLVVDNRSPLFLQLRWHKARALAFPALGPRSERLNYWLRVFSIALIEEELPLPELSPTTSASAPE